MLAAVKTAAGRSLSRVTTSPSRAVASMAPVGAARLLARSGGGFPLVLWWAFTVARGVLPVLMSWLVFRYLHVLLVCLVFDGTVSGRKGCGFFRGLADVRDWLLGGYLVRRRACAGRESAFL